MLINKRIKEVRNVLDLTQSKFSRRIAISTSYLAAIELGNKRAHDRVVRLIINEFNVCEVWLRTGEGEMFADDLSAATSKIISIFTSLTPEFQKYAIEQMTALDDLDRSLKLLK